VRGSVGDEGVEYNGCGREGGVELATEVLFETGGYFIEKTDVFIEKRCVFIEKSCLFIEKSCFFIE
jgi:hypothetical protein